MSMASVAGDSNYKPIDTKDRQEKFAAGFGWIHLDLPGFGRKRILSAVNRG